MATITRRNWSEIKTETIKRSGGINYSAFGTRVEQAVWSAYQDIACLYPHFPLMTYLYFSQGTSLNYKELPSDLWAVLGVSEENTATGAPGAPLRRLTIPEYLGAGTKAYAATAKPDGYFLRSSFSDPTTTKALVFNVTNLDTARNYYLFYQRTPTAPDFASTTTYPQTDSVWDEHLIELALLKIGTWSGDSHLATTNAALYKDFVSQIGIEPLRETMTAAMPEGKVSNTQSSGKNP